MPDEIPFDPLSPDAPLIHLLSVRKNPVLIRMNPDQLMDLAIQLRTRVTEAEKPKRKPKAPKAPSEPKPKKLTFEERRQQIRDTM
jgi:hypothetical protein